MKIARIEVFFLRHKYADHLRYQFTGGRVETLDLALIRATSETGEYGLGELTFGQFTAAARSRRPLQVWLSHANVGLRSSGEK